VGVREDWRKIGGRRVMIADPGSVDERVPRVPTLESAMADLSVVADYLKQIGKAMERLTGSWPYAEHDAGTEKEKKPNGVADDIAEAAHKLASDTGDLLRALDRLVSFRGNGTPERKAARKMP